MSTYLPTGETFRTADDSLSFAQFGTLVSEAWNKAYKRVPMYPAGTPSDEVTYPNITWTCAGRKRMNGAKNRVVDEFVSDEGTAVTKKIGVYRCVFEVRVSADTPQEANQLIEAFERFMEQCTGAFKKAGARELLYVERRVDTWERISAKVISHRTVQYEMHEQVSYIEDGPTIEDIQVIAHAIRSTTPVL